MISKDINSKIAKLAKINESVSQLHFEAIQDEDGSDWLVRIGIVRVVNSLSEEEARKISDILNSSIEIGFKQIISENSSEIKLLIDSITDKQD